MKMRAHRLIAALLSATCIATSVGCYYPSNYPSQNQAGSYNGGSKDGMAYESTDAPPPQPTGRYVVDPAVAIAGVAAAGLIGYAIGNNNNYPRYYGPAYGGGYYRPAYGPGYYGPGRPGMSYGRAYNSYNRR